MIAGLRYARFVAVGAMLCGAVGCAMPAARADQKETRLIELKVAERNGDQLRPVGVIVFSPDMPNRLNLIGNDDFTRRLEGVWQDITGRPTLSMASSRDVVRDGRSTRVYGTKAVAPGDPNYPWAIYDVLERQYGYRVEIVR